MSQRRAGRARNGIASYVWPRVFTGNKENRDLDLKPSLTLELLWGFGRNDSIFVPVDIFTWKKKKKRIYKIV